jgi:hypothetical protein
VRERERSQEPAVPDTGTGPSLHGRSAWRRTTGGARLARPDDRAQRGRLSAVTGPSAPASDAPAPARRP